MCTKPRGGKISQTIFILESKFGQESYRGVLFQAILLLKGWHKTTPEWCCQVSGEDRLFGGLTGIFFNTIIPFGLYHWMVTESYYQQGINPDENILMFPHYRSDSKPQDLLIQVLDSFPHLWRFRKKNYSEQTHHSFLADELWEYTHCPGRARGSQFPDSLAQWQESFCIWITGAIKRH